MIHSPFLFPKEFLLCRLGGGLFLGEAGDFGSVLNLGVVGQELGGALFGFAEGVEAITEFAGGLGVVAELTQECYDGKASSASRMRTRGAAPALSSNPQITPLDAGAAPDLPLRAGCRSRSYRIDFFCADATLIASSGNATSIGFSCVLVILIVFLWVIS
ncbi:MAG TPA: hypothetical protein PLE92_01505 [Lentisphaeria bacterium]|nr:hypothetical protein [Lentisphaerota bacterium]HQC51779.1 hypothetical protein [Lentisphaeria bacterium]